MQLVNMLKVSIIAAAGLVLVPVATHAQVPAPIAAPAPDGPTYADLATFSDAAELVIRAQIRRQTTLKPDAFVRFEVGDFVASVFVEVDMATESPTTLHTKLETYRRHWMTDAEQIEHEVYPEVLWLVPTAGRRRVLEKVIDRQPEETRALHRARLYDDSRAAFIEPP